MKIMHIGFIGAGKVGFTLGKYFAEHNICISGYYSRNADSAEEAAKFTGSCHYEQLSDLLINSDVIFITVSDGVIGEVFNTLRQYDLAGKQLCHCSGALSSCDAFPDIENIGATGYSVHPLFPISNRYDSYLAIDKAWFCIEGDRAHLEDWRTFFESLGNPVRVLSAENKIKYHAACTVASNLVCALIAESTEMLEKCGFNEKEALSALEPLITTNISNTMKYGVVSALTGPVERCDYDTVKKHLSCFDTWKEREMYRTLSLKLVDIAMKKHHDTKFSGFDKILS